MRIPSYDDLTPSIPDVSPGDVLASVSRLLRGDAAPVASRVVRAAGTTRQLFAALVSRRALERANARDAVRPPARQAPELERLMQIARDFSPRIERHPGGPIVLDVAGLQRLIGDPPAIAGQLARAGAPNVAVATSWIAAMLLACARPGITVAASDPETALRDVPLAILEQYVSAVDDARPAGRQSAAVAAAREQTFDVLRRWGITRLGELAALPAAELSARLGAEGIALQRLARGIDPRLLMPDPGVTRFVQSCELEWPIDALEPLSFVFARLLDPLASALERADRGAAAVHVELRLTDRTSHARTLQLPAVMRDPKVLRTLLLLDLESHPPSAGVDVVTIEVDPAPSRIVQYSLLERAVPAPETLATLMARLGALVGAARCGSPTLLDTHQPDGVAMAPVTFTEEARGHARRAVSLACDAKTDVPPCVLRRFRPPVAVRVAVEGGRPVRVAIDRRGMPGGTVQQAAGPWRTSGAWWAPERWNRDEWDVSFTDGVVCRLFRDRETGMWFIEGVFD